ncbi:response regulator [Kiloniella sp. b19]|uniref:response regulator n=1 Tax=Kiloniella sp. GXU_MW_B19 TaxID=3141326 RepID=UPI0031E181A4
MSSSGINITEEEVNQQAEAEILDEARDVASSLEVTLQQVRTGGTDPKDALARMSGDVSNIRLKAKSVNVPGLTAITHRLEEYMSSVKELDDKAIGDLQTYSDKISSLLDGESVDVSEIAEVVRSMPHHSTFNVEDIEIDIKEVVLVVPQKIAGKVVARELEACGYRVTTIMDPFDAIALIMELKPDMIMTSMVLPRMSGADLACALSAMPSTKHIPVTALTSLEPSHPDMRALPVNVGVVRRGPNFGDDLAQVLSKFQIT